MSTIQDLKSHTSALFASTKKSPKQNFKQQDQQPYTPKQVRKSTVVKSKSRSNVKAVNGHQALDKSQKKSAIA